MMSRITDRSDPPRVRNLIGGRWCDASATVDVIDPYRKEIVSRAAVASASDVDDAVACADTARQAAAMPGYKRAEWLRQTQSLVRQRAKQFAVAITRETGKPIRDARIEVSRSIETLGLCAEEAIRIEGKHVPLDGSELGAGKLAVVLRFPVGVVGAIVPFNAPLNMACHKVGPAIAAGNAVVLKTPPETPSCLQLLAQAFMDAGLPAGVLNVLNGDASVGDQLVRDPRVGFVTFTGSTRAGAAVKAAVGLRRATLELGGLGPNIVEADADAPTAATQCASNGTRLAGQSCVSVQNLFVHEEVLDAFLPPFVDAMRALKLGDPMAEDTAVGPMINQDAAERVQNWVDEARAAGARLLCGGKRHDAFYEPTALIDVTPDMKVVCQEIFGPVVVVRPYADISEPIGWINGTGVGLNCGLFTNSTRTAMRAIREIRCGGIIVNGTSTFRPDQTPYGGVGQSGNGREGPSRAVLDMTEERLVVFNY